MTDFTDNPHGRYNALTGDKVLVSPHRTKRPWQGKQETTNQDTRPSHDAKCYLCSGNLRAEGERNPEYTGTYVFTNDYSALLPATSGEPDNTSELLRSEPTKGECRVICFSPRHDWTLPEMPLEAIRGVVDVWSDQITELGQKYAWVQLFENKGDIMGCSNPHPHGQVWASDFVPNEPLKEDVRQREYFRSHGSPLLLDYASVELGKAERIVAANKDWMVVVPFWATWPYETLLMPRQRHILRMNDLTDDERDSLAEILKTLLTRYDNLFEVSFPYSMGWHGAPTSDGDYSHWQLHAHFYPPLLRSATVKKFMVGYEMLAQAQRDLTPEQAAKTLSELPIVHYKVK